MQPIIGIPYSDDEMRGIRGTYCAKENLNLVEDYKCVEAGIGHPNSQFGAVMFSNDIIFRLFPTPTPCALLDKKYRDLFNDLLSLQQKYVAATPGAIRADLMDQIADKRSNLKIAFDDLSTSKRDYYNNSLLTKAVIK